VLATYFERRQSDRKWNTGLLLLLFLALSFSQIVVFSSFLGAILGTELLAGRGHLRIRIAGVFGFAVVTVGLARLLGGFFTPQPGGDLILFNPKGPTGGLSTNFGWNFTTFGLLLPLGGAGVFVLWRRGRREAALTLAALIVGGLGMVNLFAYRYSLDVFKFGSIVALALGIAAGVAIGRVADLVPRRAGLATAAVLAATTAIAGGAT
jgi:hypothetical protein